MIINNILYNYKYYYTIKKYVVIKVKNLSNKS